MFAMYFVFSCETSKSQDKRVNCTAKVVTCKARVKKGKPRLGPKLSHPLPDQVQVQNTLGLGSLR